MKSLNKNFKMSKITSLLIKKKTIVQMDNEFTLWKIVIKLNRKEHFPGTKITFFMDNN